MQIIFQDPYASLDPRTPIGDSIGEGLRIHDIGTAPSGAAKVRQIMDLVGLPPYQARRYPHEFSGGQRQRIGIARALVLEPDLIVCDEPVSALDVSIQAQVLNLLKHLQRELGLTYLFIAHNMGVVEHISDRVAVMYLGRIVEQADRRDALPTSGHPYTQALMSAIPIPDPTLRRQRIILRGDVPSPINPPPGCRFHPRCPLYEQLGQPRSAPSRCPRCCPRTANHRVACHFRGAAAATSGAAGRAGRHGRPRGEPVRRPSAPRRRRFSGDSVRIVVSAEAFGHRRGRRLRPPTRASRAIAGSSAGASRTGAAGAVPFSDASAEAGVPRRTRSSSTCAIADVGLERLLRVVAGGRAGRPGGRAAAGRPSGSSPACPAARRASSGCGSGSLTAG